MACRAQAEEGRLTLASNGGMLCAMIIDWRDWRWVVAALAVGGFFYLIRHMPADMEGFFRDLKQFVDSLFGS